MKTLEELNKKPSVITSVATSVATFKDSTDNYCYPTFINSFFGNNGTGKSTVAKSIENKENITVQTGLNLDDYDIKIYNEEFVKETIVNAINPQNPNKDIPGVFTISAGNGKIEKEIGELLTKNKELQKNNQGIQKEIEKNISAGEALKNDSYKELWKKSEELRSKYPNALLNKRPSVKDFCDWVVDEKEPVQLNMEDYDKQYNLAFNNSGKKYTPIAYSGFLMPSNSLLEEKIINSSNSDFSNFMKKIDAITWVRAGHEKFHDKAHGICPYCQQALPNDFEKKLKESFDVDYENKINQLSTFKTQYANMGQHYCTIWSDFEKNEFFMDHPEELKKLKTIIQLLTDTISDNVRRIEDKINNPEEPITLLAPDTIKGEIENLIDNVNKTIAENNKVIDDKKTAADKCKADLRKHIAFQFAADIATYKTKRDTLVAEIKESTEARDKNDKAIKTNKAKVTELKSRVTNVTACVDNIKRLLLNSGFTSFTIREKANKPNYYEIVRSDGSIATNLSEGERNFLAFLYFHQQVLGFNNEDDEITQKIVVIDDPVSSMDSSALFVVSSLIRQMFTLCPGHYNKKESNIEISQIFILTHNALFHHYVTAGYDDPRHYNYFSFFEVKKKNEVSAIIPSLKELNGNIINKNPQKSYYTSLWDAYNEVDSSNALITLMRQILNSYFIQTCGRTEEDIIDDLTINHADKFIVGSDTSKLELLKLIVAFIDTPSGIFQDDVYSTSSGLDLTECKDVFKTIFEALGQEQHYNQMMKTAIETEKAAK